MRLRRSAKSECSLENGTFLLSLWGTASIKYSLQVRKYILLLLVYLFDCNVKMAWFNLEKKLSCFWIMEQACVILHGVERCGQNELNLSFMMSIASRHHFMKRNQYDTQCLVLRLSKAYMAYIHQQRKTNIKNSPNFQQYILILDHIKNMFFF